MARRKYTATELNNLSVEQLIKIVNRQAEMYNKQVTRAKKAGIWNEITQLNPNAGRSAMIRGGRLKKLKSMKERDARKALMEIYLMRERKAQGGYTKRNLKNMQERAKNIKDMLDKMSIPPLIEKPHPDGKHTYIDLDEVDQIAEDASIRRDMYYEILKAGVQTGVYNSFAKVDKPVFNPEDFRQRYEEERAKINPEIEKIPEDEREELDINTIDEYSALYSSLANQRADLRSFIASAL